jgi:hypothetical protein
VPPGDEVVVSCHLGTRWRFGCHRVTTRVVGCKLVHRMV